MDLRKKHINFENFISLQTANEPSEKVDSLVFMSVKYSFLTISPENIHVGVKFNTAFVKLVKYSSWSR